MSKRRPSVGLAPPIGRGTAAVLALAAVLAGCYGARPVASPAQSAALGPGGPNASGRPGRIPAAPRGVTGRTWLAEGPRGWEAGQIGGKRIALAHAEVGIAADDDWILSAVLRPIGSTKLVVRPGPDGDPLNVDLGGLAPTASVIVGDRAYVSGFSFVTPHDPGILEVDLAAGTSRVLLAPSAAAGTRYLAASPDGSTLVSALCDLRSDPEPASCAMTVIALVDGTARAAGNVPGGLLRGTSASVAVVAPQGAEAPGWLAGIDLATGRELWRVHGGEFGPSLMTRTHGLVQQLIRTDGPKPRLVIETVDLRLGTVETVYQETGDALHALWPALSSDSAIAIGVDATGSRALSASADAHTAVRLVPIEGGDAIDLPLALRSNQ